MKANRHARLIRAVSIAAHVAPYLLAGAGWALVIFGRSGR